ncbi:MAG: hypothetical protein AAGB46_02565 [Verrucomicrobiota bacterium]
MLIKRLFALFCGFLLAASAYVFVFHYQFGARMPSEAWVGCAAILKEEILKRDVSDNRILIYSGSNSIYGIDSEKLTEASGREVFNMSLHAGLPMEYLVWQIMKQAKAGDTLLMPLEYDYYTDTEGFEEWFTHAVMCWEQDYYEELSLYQKFEFMSSVRASRVFFGAFFKANQGRIDPFLKKYRNPDRNWIVKDVEDAWSKGEYRMPLFPTSYNRRGDMMMNEGGGISGNDRYLKGERVSDYFAAHYRSLMEYAEENAIRVYLIWPVSMKNPSFDLGKKSDQERFARFRESLDSEGVQVYGDAEKLQLPRELFYNTQYHLNSEGRTVWTDRIATILKEAGEFL